MNKLYLILGIILLIASLLNIVLGCINNRLEFCFIGFIGSIGISECIKKSLEEEKWNIKLT